MRDFLPGMVAAWLSVGIGGVLIVLLFLRQSVPQVDYYHPVGYVRKVQSLIDDKRLVYDQKTKKIRFDETAPQQIVDFYRYSYLQQDVANFNDSGQGGGFYLVDGELKVDHRARRITLPFTKHKRWNGSLSYQQTTVTAVLENGRARVSIIKPAPERLPLKPKDFQPLMVPGLKGEYEAHAYWLSDHDRQRYFALLQYVGDDVVLGVQRPDTKVAINGNHIPVDHRVRLEDGDMLTLQGRGFHDILVFKAHETTSLLSRSRLIGGHVQRSDEVDILPLAAQLITGINAVLQARDTRDNVQQFDVKLSLDQKLQETIQHRLETYLEHLDNKKPKAAPAAITLLDIKDGDLLALASYPAPEQIPRFPELSESQRQRLALNQNLLIHPVGSSAKPFLAAAVWEACPRLGNLKIGMRADDVRRESRNGHNLLQVEQTLGLKLAFPFEVSYHCLRSEQNAFPIDRKAFMKYSSNLYMVNLFLLGLACQEDGQILFTQELMTSINSMLGSEEVRFKPDLSTYLAVHEAQVYQSQRDASENPMDYVIIGLEQHPVIQKLGQLFDIEIKARGSTDPDENTAARYDTDLLRPLMTHLGLDKIAARPMYGVVAEQVNLRFNQIQALRRDLISFILGGSTAEWTNVKLAEAMARVVSGKRVRARLIVDVTDQDGRVYADAPEILTKLPLKQQTFEWLHEELQLPTTSGGTALELAKTIQSWNTRLESNDVELQVFSKTGTPRKHEASIADSALFIFCAQLKRISSGAFLDGICGAIYIEERGKSRVAVRLARDILEDIVIYLCEIQHGLCR